MKIKNRGLFAFLVVYHLLLVLLLPAFLAVATWEAALFFLLTFSVGGLSITAGYHRLYAHRSYTANALFEWCVLIGSTLSLQMSALKWSHDHRLHHQHVDTDRDPYSIRKGFWYAHVLWLFDYQRSFDKSLVSDLLANPRVMLQDRYFPHLVVGVNLAVFGVGCLLIGPLASFYLGFLVRMAAIHHSTWSINSLCHTMGSKTYARELSAVDNTALALLTWGEGYHNYHHAFAADHRNGIRWYHFDPTKWLIHLAAKLGCVRNLRVINDITIQKSLVLRDKKMLMEHLGKQVDALAAEMALRLDELAAVFDEKATKVRLKMRELKESGAAQRGRLRAELREFRASLKETWREWVQLTRMIEERYQLAH